MAITISGQNNNDKILASDGVLDSISGFNVVGVMTAAQFDVTGKTTTNHISIGNNIHLGNAGIITATTLLGNVTGNINHESNLLLQISGSEKFRVGNGGQFGIAGANYGTAGQVFTSGGSGSAPTWSTINSDKITEGNTEAEVVDTGSDGHFKVTTEGSERLRVTSNGKIGIGTASPTFAAGGGVHLQGGNEFTSYKVSAHTNTGVDFAQDAAGVAYVYNRDNADLILGTNNAQRVRINNSGAIGLGGANYGTSGQVLTSGGSGSAATWSTVDLSAVTGATGDFSIADKIVHTGDTNTAIRFPSADTITAETSGLERLRITSDGKIGINKNSPSKELHVSGNAGAGIIIESSGTTNGGVLDLRNTQGSNQTYRLAVGGGDNAYVLGRGFFIRDDNNSATRFVINTNGRIGINELNPQQQLHVHDDTGYQGILINGNGAPRIAFARSTTTTGEWSVGIDGTNGNDFVINNSNNNSNRMFIIGSAAGNNKITCGANTQINGNLIMASAGNGIDFSATANGGSGTPSELLDDYEEGYFAPEITNLTSGYGSGTFYNRQCRYTKVGNMVTCWGHIQWWGNAVTSGADNQVFTITGFPFEVDGVGYRGTCGGSVVAQSWRYAGSAFNNYNVDSDNVQVGCNANEEIQFFVYKHNSITGQVTQKSINGYNPNIEFCFQVRVTSYK